LFHAALLAKARGARRYVETTPNAEGELMEMARARPGTTRPV
jgi:hypothetical protein